MSSRTPNFQNIPRPQMVLIDAADLAMAEEVIRQARRIVRRHGHLIEQWTDVKKLVFRDQRVNIVANEPSDPIVEFYLRFDGLRLNSLVEDVRLVRVDWDGQVKNVRKNVVGSIGSELAALRDYLTQLSVLDDLASVV